MIKYCLVGKHQHRTPLSYPAFHPYLPAGLIPVDLADNPDVLVFGYVQDFHESFNLIQEARQHNEKLKVVVLSEEPFWDTLWSGDYTQRETERVINGASISYHAVNHTNSRVYEYRKIPYIVTTEDAFFARYSMLFRRNAACSERDFRRIWGRAAVNSAFYAESRLADKFAYAHPENDVQGLCQFRSRLAQLALEADPEKTVVVGKGWHTGAPRQKLPDWHLDKLAALDSQSHFISALENTHQPHYTTEKLFDAYACRGIPLYWASPNHSIKHWLPMDSYINLYGQTPEEALETIQSFVDDQAFMEQYRAAQSELAERFGNAGHLAAERQRVAKAVFDTLSDIVEA